MASVALDGIYLNRYRAARGLIGSEFVTRVSRRGTTLYFDHFFLQRDRVITPSYARA